MIIVDLDGTLTKLNSEALHCMGHLEREDILRVMDPVAIAKLEPRLDVIKMIDEMRQTDPVVVIITSRWNYLGWITVAWLKAHNVQYSAVAMRKAEEWKMKSVDVKMTAYKQLKNACCENHMESMDTWIDDDMDMLDAAAALGMKIVKV